MKTCIRYSLGSLVIALLAGGSLNAQTPIAHWTFDEGVNDYSITTSQDTQGINGAGLDTSDAAYAGAASTLGWTAGKVGGAAILDGGNGDDLAFHIADVAALNNSFNGATFMGWLKGSPNQTGSEYKGLLMTRSIQDSTSPADDPGTIDVDESHQENWGLAWVRSDQNADTRISGASLQSPANSLNLIDGQWHHLAMVWDPDAANAIDPKRSVYIDGNQVASFNDFSLLMNITDGGSWDIGRDPLSTSRNFGGEVDDVAIFNSPLSAAEISTIVSNAGLGIDAAGNPTGVIAAGDVDGGGVSLSDFNIIKSNFLSTVTGRNQGDLNGDKIVNLQDYAQWAAAAPALAASVSLVPEPGSLALLGLAGLFGLNLRTRRRS